MDESGAHEHGRTVGGFAGLGEGRATLRPMAGEGELNVHRDFPG
jgi:hypothetical protein